MSKWVKKEKLVTFFSVPSTSSTKNEIIENPTIENPNIKNHSTETPSSDSTSSNENINAL